MFSKSFEVKWLVVYEEACSFNLDSPYSHREIIYIFQHKDGRTSDHLQIWRRHIKILNWTNELNGKISPYLKRKWKRETIYKKIIHESCLNNFLHSNLGSKLSWKVKSVSGEVVHTVKAYLGFCSIKQLGAFLLPLGWDVSPCRVTHKH